MEKTISTVLTHDRFSIDNVIPSCSVNCSLVIFQERYKICVILSKQSK